MNISRECFFGNTKINKNSLLIIGEENGSIPNY